jgi:hypothetical protein
MSQLEVSLGSALVIKVRGAAAVTARPRGRGPPQENALNEDSRARALVDRRLSLELVPPVAAVLDVGSSRAEYSRIFAPQRERFFKAMTSATNRRVSRNGPRLRTDVGPWYQAASAVR